MEVGKDWQGGAFSGPAVGDKSSISRIMLKFRPIAPKPVTTDGSVSDSLSSSSSKTDPPKRKPKRKYVRVNHHKNNKNNDNIVRNTTAASRRCKTVASKDVEAREDLPFDGSHLVSLTAPPAVTGAMVSPDVSWSAGNMSFEPHGPHATTNLGLDSADRSDRAVLESWVVVNGMTETVLDAGALGATDGEKLRNLEADTCPGLISDGVYRVQWVNRAYKRMVDPLQDAVEVVVRLVLNDHVPAVAPAFACTARVVYAVAWRRDKVSKTMPCDVWRMDSGGFAWRLDAKAALSLGR